MSPESSAEKCGSFGEMMAEVTPGKFVPLVAPVHVPRYVLGKLLQNPDGSYNIVPVNEWAGWVKLHDIAGDVDMPDLSAQSLRRLIIAGFVDGMQPTPGIQLINLDSLFEHLARVRIDDPDDSWWTPARRRAWAAAR